MKQNHKYYLNNRALTGSVRYGPKSCMETESFLGLFSIVSGVIASCLISTPRGWKYGSKLVGLFFSLSSRTTDLDANSGLPGCVPIVVQSTHGHHGDGQHYISFAPRLALVPATIPFLKRLFPLGTHYPFCRSQIQVLCQFVSLLLPISPVLFFP